MRGQRLTPLTPMRSLVLLLVALAVVLVAAPAVGLAGEDVGESAPPPAAEAARSAPPAAAGPAPETATAAEAAAGADAPSVPDLGQPEWMVIPSIGLNARVREVGISNGTYEIPWFDVGWQNDSQPIGVPGNTVFNGHVDTIDAGRVFLRLKDLAPGDAIYVYTPEYRSAWVVESSEAVPNTDWSFIYPTDDLRITLYTCEGTWSWATRQYSHYRVVVARLHEYVARETDQAAAPRAEDRVNPLLSPGLASAAPGLAGRRKGQGHRPVVEDLHQHLLAEAPAGHSQPQLL